MHELAICQALMDRINSLAQRYDGVRLERVVLLVGPLSGAEPKLLRNAFPLAAAGSVAAEATLDIEFSPVQIRCRRCEITTTVPGPNLCCPGCGNWQTQLVGGDELVLQRLEFESMLRH